MGSDCSVCQLTNRLVECGHEHGVKTAFDRVKEQKGCPFGEKGICCRLCNMGPCRINPKKEVNQGVCGADATTIAARNFARMVAAGTAAHSDHAREVTKVFIKAAKGEIPGYKIKDFVKLNAMAEIYGVETDGKSVNEIATALGEKCLEEFGRQEGEMTIAKRAPETRQAIWRELGIYPRGVDMEVVQLMHRTHMGVDQDYRNIMRGAMRTALADGWGGSMIATELQDIMFGTPKPLRGQVNLCVLKKDEVNIVVHGHEPLLSEMIVMASRKKELLEYAKSKGANGINISGICCTANEVLQRHGIPVAGNFTHQELAVLTGAVDAMVVDVQCIMQGLVPVAEKFHTDIITTSFKARIEGAKHIEFEEDNPVETAETIIKAAIDNFPKRGKVVDIPGEPVDMVVGFSHEYINYMLGGRFRASYRPLNDNIINGKIRGVAGVVGCDTPGEGREHIVIDLVKELLANDILVLETGCAAHITGREGLMIPEAASKYAGAGLAEVCETVGIPPVLHLGACVDNSRILIAASHIVAEGGLGTDLSQVPAAGCAPDWMSEKAIAIGLYFVASGVYTVFHPNLPVEGSPEFTNFLLKEIEELTKGCWDIKTTAADTAAAMIDRINQARENLGIAEAKERVLYDMEMRRQLEV